MLSIASIVGVIVVTALIAVPWIFMLLVPLIALICIPIALPFAFIELSKMVRHLWYKGSLAKKLRILIVDDDAISVLPLINALSSKISKINLVENGQQMLSALDEGKFDLVFLDQMMPGISGDEALSIGERQLSLDKKVPVVFFSNYTKELLLPEYEKFEIKGIWDKHVPFTILSEKINTVFSEVTA